MSRRVRCRKNSLAPARVALAAACLVALGCGSDGGAGPAGGVTFLQIEREAYLLVGVGEGTALRVTAFDAAGEVVNEADLTWTVDDPSIARVEASGVRVTGLAEGATRIRVSSGSANASASVEVYVDPNTGPFEPGIVYYGRRDYAEYEPGDLPLILSAPHGGYLLPDEVPERTFGVTAQDRRTQELTRELADAIEVRTGRRPYVIISRLHRRKLDPNREIVEAAQGDPFAEQAWREFQGFIDEASAAVEAEFEKGLYIDMHGHGHPIDRVELGYRLTSSDLEVPDAFLDQGGRVEKSSVRQLAADVNVSFAELIRGPSSLGGLLEARGYRSVPSPSDPDPGGNPYFTGGYNTERHGSRAGGGVSGVQFEHQFDGLRETPETRAAYVAELVEVLEAFLLTHYGYDWTAGG